MNAVISHRKSMSLDLSVPAIKVFDGKNKFAAAAPGDCEPTIREAKISGRLARVSAMRNAVLFFFHFN